MCLTKWMLYLKEIGLLNYNKNASIQKARHIFVKYQDSKKRFLFNNFKNAVLELLSLIYNEDP
jgi:predicted transcriptional regulator